MIINAKDAYNIANEIYPADQFTRSMHMKHVYRAARCMQVIAQLIMSNSLDGYQSCAYNTWGLPTDIKNEIKATLTINGYTVNTSETDKYMIKISWSEPISTNIPGIPYKPRSLNAAEHSEFSKPMDVIDPNDRPADDMVCYDYLLDVGPEVKDNKENDSNESDNVFGQLGDMLRPH